MTMPVQLEPVPIDDYVLTRQASHRSARMWDLNGLEESVVLTCRHRELALSRVAVDLRLLPLIEPVGFAGLMKVPFIQLDWHLITALVARWRPKTHSFHMPTGETTITLQDVRIQLGLRVDGRPITGRMDYNWPKECDRLLGVKPTGSKLQGGRLNLGWLEKALLDLPDNADDATLRKYARAYILQLMGVSIFSDKSSKCLHLMFLPLLEDLDQGGQYSGGSRPRILGPTGVLQEAIERRAAGEGVETMNTQELLHRALTVEREDTDFVDNSAWLTAVLQG